MNGSCLLLVAFRTSSRTKPNALRRSNPGVVKCSANAVAKGLDFVLSPSEAVKPAFAANAIMVLGLGGSTLARPRPMERRAIVCRMVLVNGLSRQASRMIRRSRLAGSTAIRTRSSESASS